MKRLLMLGFIPVALAASAQTMDHSSMPGMVMSPSSETDTSSPRPASPPAADHSSMPGMTMPAVQPSPQDQSVMPGINMDSGGSNDAINASQIDVPHFPPPPPPQDHAADSYYAPDAMAAARGQLAEEHGGATFSKVMVNLAEYQVRDGADGYRWDSQALYGGDINRFVIKSEGEGTINEGVESAEIQALYSRAVGVYTDIQAGLRQDFNPSTRTYATIGAETLLPYWFEVEGAAFLSNKGEFLGRLEGYYDLPITNYVILQPRAELNFSTQDSSELRLGSGLTNAELGLRLRYEITREFAPYIGISWDRKAGQTADFARARGQSTEDTSLVIGIRSFF